MGTANILEAIKTSNYKCTAIIVTSDKSYDNVEQVEGNRVLVKLCIHTGVPIGLSHLHYLTLLGTCEGDVRRLKILKLPNNHFP